MSNLLEALRIRRKEPKIPVGPEGVVSLIRKYGRYEEASRCPDFPSYWLEDIEAVYAGSHHYLSPLLALFVQDVNAKYPDYVKYTPVRSGQIYSGIASLLGYGDFTDFSYPLSARKALWKPGQELGGEIKNWYYSEENPFRTHNERQVIVDWGVSGSIPTMANRIKHFSTYRMHMHSGRVPGTIDAQASFLFSNTESPHPSFCPRLPPPDQIVREEELRSESDSRFRGLLNLAEVTHDRLRGPLRSRYYDDDWAVAPERGQNPNVVIWALNLAAQCGVYDWIKQNKDGLTGINKTQVIDDAVAWASDFDILDFDRFTFRFWTREIARSKPENF